MKIALPQKSLKKVFRFSIWAILAFCAIAAVLSFLYILSAKTSPSGKLSHPGLTGSVQIHFDESDIPHIETKFQNDAWFAIGYLHARERSWQMEFNRRLASGSLSELLGENTVGVDRFIRTLGIRSAAHAQFELLPSSTKLVLQSYANGVNAGFTDLGWALPIEFLLTGSKPGYWTPVDTLSWSMMMALDLGDNWNKEFSRMEMASFLPTERIWEIMPPYPGESPATSVDFATLYKDLGIYKKAEVKEVQKETSSKISAAEKQLMAWMPGGIEGIGSNNWVVSGKRSTTGKPWLANDPHLGLTAPAVWYFAHLKANDLNVIGATTPGIPTVILGRTDQFAWGFTNTSPDVQDLFIEQIDPKNPTAYKTPDGMAKFKVRRESIQIKGKPPLNFMVRESRHGPIISDAFPRSSQVIDTSKYVLALKWTALDPKNQTIQASLDSNRAKNLDEFKLAIRKHYAPMQNIVMADVEGNIAFEAAGVSPKRNRGSGLGGVVPALGWDKQYDWTEYVPTKNLPADENPSKGWIATANQRVQEANDPHPLTADWSPPYRYQRIEELLEKKTKHDLQSMMEIQADVLSKGSTPLIPFLQSVKSKHPLSSSALQALSKFDGNMKVDSSAALIFNAWADQLARRIFAPHLKEMFASEYGKRGLRTGLNHIISEKIEFWCDHPVTKEVETCADANQEAFDAALNYLSQRYGNNIEKWSWGEAHQAISEHRPLSRAGIIGSFFEISRPVPGDGFTVNVGRTGFENPNQPFATYNAASMRAIYDFSDLEKSLFIYQSGQSGWAHTPRYRQYATDWSKNQYLPLAMSPKSGPKRELVLEPR